MNRALVQYQVEGARHVVYLQHTNKELVPIVCRAQLLPRAPLCVSTHMDVTASRVTGTVEAALFAVEKTQDKLWHHLLGVLVRAIHIVAARDDDGEIV